jgi:hypothetical protein
VRLRDGTQRVGPAAALALAALGVLSVFGMDGVETLNEDGN